MKLDDVLDGDGGRVGERQPTSLVSLEDDRDEASKHVLQGRMAGQRKTEGVSAEGNRPLHGRQKSPPAARASSSPRDRRRACRREKTRSSRTEDWATDVGWGDHRRRTTGWMETVDEIDEARRPV
jgi:hypothetical protein